MKKDKKTVSYEEALDAIRSIILYLGDDPDRPGLVETPARFLHAWSEEWGIGYWQNPLSLLKLFEDINQHRSPMILVKNVAYSSHCEHHLCPFHGTATVAYIADRRGVLGLSKVARLVTHFASRLTVQERLTEDIADFFYKHVTPNCGVILSGTHLCMTTRGAKQPGASMVTSALRGVFYSDPVVRAEFLKLAQ